MYVSSSFLAVLSPTEAFEAAINRPLTYNEFFEVLRSHDHLSERGFDLVRNRLGIEQLELAALDVRSSTPEIGSGNATQEDSYLIPGPQRRTVEETTAPMEEPESVEERKEPEIADEEAMEKTVAPLQPIAAEVPTNGRLVEDIAAPMEEPESVEERKEPEIVDEEAMEKTVAPLQPIAADVPTNDRLVEETAAPTEAAIVAASTEEPASAEIDGTGVSVNVDPVETSSPEVAGIVEKESVEYAESTEVDEEESVRFDESTDVTPPLPTVVSFEEAKVEEDEVSGVTDPYAVPKLEGTTRWQAVPAATPEKNESEDNNPESLKLPKRKDSDNS